MTTHTPTNPVQAPSIAHPPAEKYTATSGTAFLSGIQALVRLPLMQKWRDEQAGLNTAGFVTGYRGSPLGGLDDELWRAKKFLEPAKIKFAPAVNEDLAATAVWGTQQLELVGEATVDGVFALWTRPSQAWLVELYSPCNDIEYADTIGFRDTNGRLSARFDRVYVGSHSLIPISCTIKEIRPLDVKAIRLAEKDARGKRQVDDSPVAPVPEAPASGT